MERKTKKKYLKAYAAGFLLISILILMILFSSSCSISKLKIDAAYILKTDPEKAVIDFLKALDNKSPDYIYDNLLSVKDKNNISKEKFISEFSSILSDIDSIDIKRTVYLGYENEMSKVVVEFDVKYTGGKSSQYKKYVYLISENSKWKIVFDKTFI